MLVTMMCVTYNSAVLPFLAYAPDLLQSILGVTPAASGSDAHWAGGALTGIWTFNGYVTLAWRYEYSDYTDEFNFSVWETTATLNIKVADNLLIRPEYRHNEVNDLGDAKGLGSGRHQGDDIFAIGFSYIF